MMYKDIARRAVPLSTRMRNFARFVKDIALTACLAFLFQKVMLVLYITLHNAAGVEPYWPYALSYSNWGALQEKPLQQVLSNVVFAPLVETVLFFVLPWRICSALKIRETWFIGLSLSTFTAWHVRLGWYNTAVALLVGAFLVVLFRRYARHTHLVVAFWVTALAHSLYNLLVNLV